MRKKEELEEKAIKASLDRIKEGIDKQCSYCKWFIKHPDNDVPDWPSVKDEFENIPNANCNSPRLREDIPLSDQNFILDNLFTGHCKLFESKAPRCVQEWKEKLEDETD